jgi:hypothetical protein
MRNTTRKQIKPISGMSAATVSSAPTTPAADTPLPSVKNALSKLVTPDTAARSTKPTNRADNGTAPAGKGNGASPAPKKEHKAVPLPIREHLEPLVQTTKTYPSNGRDKGTSSLVKPDTPFNLDRFKSKKDLTLANVEVDSGPLACSRIVDVNDYVRVHPDEENYWTDPLCFISVPIRGMKHEQLHIIDEELATKSLQPGQIIRMRLALASKPEGKLFLAQVPCENLDNVWNSTHLNAIREAQRFWLMAVSRAKEGAEGYKIIKARDLDAFELDWQKRSLMAHIERTFKDRFVMEPNHPAFLRKIGAKLDLK